MSSHWNIYNNWDNVEAPLKPNDMAVKQFDSLLGLEKPKTILLLGCTDELCFLAAEQTAALDKSQERINRWLKNSEDAVGICGNWFDIPEHVKITFDCVLGDGSFNLLNGPTQWQKIIDNCNSILNKPGKVLIRIYEAPKESLSMPEIKNLLYSGKIANFSCLKLYIWMYLSNNGTIGVPVKWIRKCFYDWFNKEEIQEKLSWSKESIDVIDVYEHSTDIYYIPTRDMIKLAFPQAIRIPSFGYPMAEYCPFYLF